MKPQFKDYIARNQWVSQQVLAISAGFADARCRKDIDQKYYDGLTLGPEDYLHVSYDERTHRFTISSSFKVLSKVEADKRFDVWDLHPRPESASITVSADKSSDQIAADIRRRLLPVHKVNLALVQARRDASDKYWLDCRTLTEDVAEALGRPNPRAADRNYNRVLLDSDRQCGWGTVECYSDSANFEIRSVPADKAVKLAKFLATL